jgi:hypothetical protein
MTTTPQEKYPRHETHLGITAFFVIYKKEYR